MFSVRHIFSLINKLFQIFLVTQYHPHLIQSNILESKCSKPYHDKSLNDEATKDWISISDSESVAYETKFDEFEKNDLKSIPTEVVKHEKKSTQVEDMIKIQ